MGTRTATGLSELVLFEQCTDEELRQIAGLVRRRRVASGTTLIDRGTHVDQLLLLVSGTVHVAIGEELTGVLEAGDLVGELSVLGGEPATADVVVVEAAELLTIDAVHLPTLLAIPAVGDRLRAIARARLQAAPGQLVTAASVPVIRRAPKVRGRGAGLHPETRARPARTIVLATLAVAVAAATTFVLTQRNKSTVVAVEDLLASVDLSAPPIASPGTPADGGGALPAAPVDPADPDAAPPPDAGTAPDQASPTSPGAEEPAGSAPAAPGTSPSTPPTTNAPLFRPPAPGIYTYDSSGHEQISIAGARHDYPDQTHAVVQQTGGCGWTLVHHVLEEHRDERTVCSSPDLVSTLRFASWIEFFGQEDGLEYVCDPPARTMFDAPVGTVERGSCTTPEGDGEATFEGSYVGREQLTVGEQSVDTVHLGIDFTMTGAARGTSRLDQWLDPGTGLMIRIERTVDTYAKGVWGDIRYQEEATFHLASLTPRT